MPPRKHKQHRRYRLTLNQEPGTSNSGPEVAEKLEKRYFKLLQAIHHAEIVEKTTLTGQFPIGMMRQAKKLTSFIKPSSPCEITSEKVRLNTERWMVANMTILKDHYDSVIAKSIHTLPPYEPIAFEKATAYGKARYKHKLTMSSVSTLATLVKAETASSQRETETDPCFDPSRRDEEWPELGAAVRGSPTIPQRDPTPRRPRLTSINPPDPPPVTPSNPNHHPLPMEPPPKPQRDPIPRRLRITPINPADPPPVTPPNPNHHPPSPSPNLNRSPSLARGPAFQSEPLAQSENGTEVGGPGPIAGRMLSTAVEIHTIRSDVVPMLETSGEAAEDMVEGPEGEEEAQPEVKKQSSISTDDLPLQEGGGGYSLERSSSCSGGAGRGQSGPRGETSAPPETFGGTSKFRVPSPGPDFAGQDQPGLTEETSACFETSDMEDPLLCPNFDLGLLEDSLSDTGRDGNHPRGENIAETGYAMLSNVAVLGSDSIEEQCSGSSLSASMVLGAEDGGQDGARTEDTLTNQLTNGDRSSLGSAPQDPVRRVTRHPQCAQKIRLWSLEVKELVLVLGDSNLSRIPHFDYPSVQIDSFPGAQIHHLKGVLDKLTVSTSTQKVVLSVGLNNCLRHNLLETITKQFQQLVALTRRVFPNAQIFVPLIQFSINLPLRVQRLIEQTNIFLLEHFKILTMVEEHLFNVQSQDPVHWTAQTASHILESWMKQLN